ncbi:MAG: C2 family cysteine protease [Myxococcaceae bacterium]
MPLNSVDALKSRFNSALADGRISRSEVDQLISQVKDGGGVTQAENKAFQEQFGQHVDKFEADAKQRLDAFFGNEVAGLMIKEQGRRDLPDPALLNSHSGHAYEWVDGALFIEGPHRDDVIQGQIGDCYLVASLSAIASQSPEALEKAIRDNGDGTYTVRFYEGPYHSEPKQVEITIDGQLPGRSGRLYGHGSNAQELWVGLIEKAYAQWKGDYEAIGNGGSPGDVMSAVLGRPESFTWNSGLPDDVRYGELKTALAAGQSIVAATFGEDQSALYTGTGLYASHGYSVHGVSEENGEKFVQLRNPWGQSEPSGDGVDDGSFRMSLKEFTRLYSGYWVV